MNGLRPAARLAATVFLAAMPTIASAVPHFDEISIPEGSVPTQPKPQPGDLIRVCPSGENSTARARMETKGISLGCRYFRRAADLKIVEVPETEQQQLEDRAWKAYVACGSYSRECLAAADGAASAFDTLVDAVKGLISGKSTEVDADAELNALASEQIDAMRQSARPSETLRSLQAGAADALEQASSSGAAIVTGSQRSAFQQVQSGMMEGAERRAQASASAGGPASANGPSFALPMGAAREQRAEPTCLRWEKSTEMANSQVCLQWAK